MDEDSRSNEPTPGDAVGPAGAAVAHNLDEYLQAAIVSVSADRVDVSIRLVPGVAVLNTLLPQIDTDSDGVVTPQEQRAYASRVASDLSLKIDGVTVPLAVRASEFSPLARMKEGLGEIRLKLTAGLPPGGPDRSLVLENHHLPDLSAFLANCLVPQNGDIHILAQKRNSSQSVYEIDYRQAAATDTKRH
jgi:hypothetical protein